MTDFRIISLDPGGTTGWAMFTSKYVKTKDLFAPDSEYVKTFIPPGTWECGQIGPHEHHKDLYYFLIENWIEETYIVSESFEYRNDSPAGLELVSREYIGIAKLVAAQHRVGLYQQTASQGKVRNKPTAFVKPSNLKKLNLWKPGQPHAMDAYGHLLYYMINSARILRTELLEAGWK